MLPVRLTRSAAKKLGTPVDIPKAPAQSKVLLHAPSLPRKLRVLAHACKPNHAAADAKDV